MNLQIDGRVVHLDTINQVLQYRFHGEEVPAWARYNLWRHLKGGTKTFYGCKVTK